MAPGLTGPPPFNAKDWKNPDGTPMPRGRAYIEYCKEYNVTMSAAQLNAPKPKSSPSIPRVSPDKLDLVKAAKLRPQLMNIEILAAQSRRPWARSTPGIKSVNVISPGAGASGSLAYPIGTYAGGIGASKDFWENVELPPNLRTSADKANRKGSQVKVKCWVTVKKFLWNQFHIALSHSP